MMLHADCEARIVIVRLGGESRRVGVPLYRQTEAPFSRGFFAGTRGRRVSDVCGFTLFVAAPSIPLPKRGSARIANRGASQTQQFGDVCSMSALPRKQTWALRHCMFVTFVTHRRLARPRPSHGTKGGILVLTSSPFRILKPSDRRGKYPTSAAVACTA
jgi:hypothetical protein